VITGDTVEVDFPEFNVYMANIPYGISSPPPTSPTCWMEFMVEDEGRGRQSRTALLANLRMWRGRGEGLLKGLDLCLITDHRLHHPSPPIDVVCDVTFLYC
jgi:hypothetical protein